MDGHNLEDSKQSTADMSVFVQTLLQQIQSRFQTMSESIITKNILFVELSKIICTLVSNLSTSWEILDYEAKLYEMVFCRLTLDEMGDRINELEQSINDLKAEMGMEGSPSPLAPPKQKSDGANQEDDSA
ncbi:Heat shock factor-binding 1 [Gossypium arboreum]|uniref:Heat shock factor-binding 1 n=2 Tax=Gossypium arboreum TaxID=29729 RepID=A0A0B0NG55_GOSAR|nr:Heat shock factor-binding 1 [Gossypium arboreum]